MKVFLSWSGNRSKAVAELFNNWLPLILQAVDPWISTDNLEHGGIWFTDIIKELGEASTGIICLTHENKAAPWILFEAGLLLKGVTKNKVCVFLVDLKSTDVAQPLSNFNHTARTKDAVHKLIITLNKSLSKPLEVGQLDKTFEMFWPRFETELEQIVQQTATETKVVPRDQTAILEEILENTRRLEKTLRSPPASLLSMSHFISPSESNLYQTTARMRMQAAVLLLKNEIAKGIPNDYYLERAMELGIDEVEAKQIWEQAPRKTAAEIFSGAAPVFPPGANVVDLS